MSYGTTTATPMLIAIIPAALAPNRSIFLPVVDGAYRLLPRRARDFRHSEHAAPRKQRTSVQRLVTGFSWP